MEGRTDAWGIMDRLDAMQVLLAVVDAGSLSAGSRKLKTPLPNVSRKVAELERHLGTRLLIRTSRNIQLTPAGRDYVEAARRIVADMKEAEQRASGEYEQPRGALTVTTGIEFGRIVLPLVYEFLSEFPEIKLNFLAVDRYVRLLDEQVDVGVRVGHLADSSLFAVKVGEARAVTCASPSYLDRKGRPQSPDDLAVHDAVEFAQLQDGWVFTRGGHSEARPNVRLSANSVTAAYAAAVRGLGVSRLPTFMIADELRSGALVEILDDYAPDPVPIHIIYVKQGLLPLKVRAFIDWMTPRLREALKDCNEVSDDVVNA